MRVDPAWREDKHPQETLPRVEDPVALYRPSPEVIAAPTAPVLAVVLVGVNPQLTWDPSESGITEIKSYDIYRGTDGATPTLLINCPVRRDFLGGIKSIDHCTIVSPPEHPDDPWTTVIEDSPVTYLDTTVVSGHTYCYYVIANPLGNNQSTAQGPPSAPSNTACVDAPYQATPPVLSGSLSGTNAVLNWTAATITGSTITNYLLYRNVDAGAFSLFQTLGNVLTYTDTTTTVGHTYGYKVQGVPAVGVPSAFSNTVFETTRVISMFGNSAERRETRIQAVAIPAGHTTVIRILGRRRFRSSDPARYIVRKPTSSWGTTVSPTGCRAATMSLATR